jgi:hypothetical protein
MVTLMAFFIANAAEDYKPRNDLPMYSDFYSCIRPNFTSIVDCNSVIGNPFSIVFQSSSFFFKFFLGIDEFYWYLFFLSFFVYFSVLYTTSRVSPLAVISLLFLLTDFRFWEYGYNVLRAGLAIAIFMWVFYYISRKKYSRIRMKIITILPATAHTSAIIFLLPKIKKYGILFIFMSFLFAVFFYYNFDYFFKNIAPNVLPEKVFNKINFYYRYKQMNVINDKVELPVHYFIIILFGFVLYLRNSIQSKVYIYSFNIVWLLFIFSIILSFLGMGYRLIGFMPPFISIIFSFEIKLFMIKMKKYKAIQGIVFVSIIFLFSLILYKNYNLIIKAFL